MKRLRASQKRIFIREFGCPRDVVRLRHHGCLDRARRGKRVTEAAAFSQWSEYGAGYSCRWGFGAWCLWHCSWHRFFRDHHLPGRVLPIATIPRRETRGWCRWHAFWPMERVREMTQMWRLLTANGDIMIRTLLLVLRFPISPTRPLNSALYPCRHAHRASDHGVHCLLSRRFRLCR